MYASVSVCASVGGNCKERPGKWVEVVWACDEKTGALPRKEESTTEKEERNGS